MKFAKFVAAALLLAGTMPGNQALSEPLRVQGRVIDESGSALAMASVSVRGAPLEVNADGEFTLELDSPTTVRVVAAAADHYSFIHTLHRSDFVAGKDAVMPTIELVKKKAGRTLLLFAGDSMLSRRYFEPRAGEPKLVRRTNVMNDGRRLLEHVKPYVEFADYASVNMETQLSNNELNNRVPKSVTFYSPAELADLLQWAGFDYVALGNNHMFDYRDEGLRSTFAALENTTLDYSGGGFDETEARRPAVVDINGQPYSFLSYVGWAGTFSPTQVAEVAKGGAALGNSPIIAEDLGGIADDAVAVLQLHAGLEYAERPALSERTTLRQAITNGADVAIGHHPHVLQGLEIYNDRLIAYSLGNFLFDQYHYTTQLGMLLYVWMDGDQLHRAEVVPLHVNGYLPTPATGAFRYSVLTRLARLSDSSVCLHASGFHAVVESCDGAEHVAQAVAVPAASSDVPLHLRTIGASPFLPVSVDAGDRPYRLGIDILRRGDFEYARLFGAHDRTWIASRNVSLKTGDDNRLEVRLPEGGASVRTGMKVFERVFTLSNPTTVSGRIKVDGNVRVRVSLQRRRESDTLDEALTNGPMTEIAVWDMSSTEWTGFSLDYKQPRIATRSVRLLIDIEDTSDDGRGANVSLDDLAWVEWQTPWLDDDEAAENPEFATHVQLRSPVNR